MPFIGTFLNKMGHLSFDRHNATPRLKQVDDIEDNLQHGDLAVFPGALCGKMASARSS
jgi:hypothetical protein